MVNSRCLLVLILLMQSSTFVASKETLRLGYLSGGLSFAVGEAPALSLAIEDFQSSGGLPDHLIEVLVRGDACTPKEGTINALDLHLNHQIDVLLGPVCSLVCVPASYYYSSWNVAIFSESCTSALLDNKNVYDILVRVMPSYSKVGPAFAHLFNHYGWRRAFLIAPDGATYCEYGAEGIKDTFKDNNITIAEVITIPAKGPITDKEVDSYLFRVQQRARIVIFCRSVYADPAFDDQVMSRAKVLGMTEGDYLFFTYVFYPPLSPPWSLPVNATDSQVRAAVDPYFVFKKMTLADLAGPHVDEFRRRVLERGWCHPWNYSTDARPNREIEWGMFLYDATLLYLILVNETIAEGGNPSDGRNLFRKAARRSFKGMTGQVLLDEQADRDPNYWMWQITPDDLNMHLYSKIENTGEDRQNLTFVEPVYWRTADGQAPMDSPPCGFYNEHCPASNSDEQTLTFTICLVVAVTVFATAAGGYFVRKKRIEEEIRQMTWKVKFSDIQFLRGAKSGFMASLRSIGTYGTSCQAGYSDRRSEGSDTHFNIVTYKGTVVALRIYNRDSITLSKEDLVELKVMKEMNHENINNFLGACVDAPNICSLGQHCSKGILQDILQNDDINLDWLFKQSIITDLVKGMSYLHSSPLKSHGRLRSSCCLIDSRWTLKITSYGLYSFRNGEKLDQTEYRKYFDMLWTAPELLRMEKRPRYGTPKGDIYSFAIILQEVLFRALPFFNASSNPRESVERLQLGENPPFRPCLPQLVDSDAHVHKAVVAMMRDCWTERPHARPTFDDLRKHLRSINKDRKGNIMDNMVLMLEKYANNLEDIVQQRTAQLLDEKKKTDSLLYRMLPSSVAERLKSGKPMDAEVFECVTIYFSDIVGFTALSSQSTPMQVVDLLNDLYTVFDDTISKHDVYKVETIGDAYMVVSGVPQRNGQRHVAEIANMALDLLSGVTEFRIRHMPEKTMQLRIGLHSGPCAAGVVGLTMPRYCLFGDTVNMASRMESTGQAFRIHISQQTKHCLDNFPGYDVKCRGDMEIKGKGLQTTYWLLNKDGYEKHKFTNLGNVQLCQAVPEEGADYPDFASQTSDIKV